MPCTDSPLVFADSPKLFMLAKTFPPNLVAGSRNNVHSCDIMWCLLYDKILYLNQANVERINYVNFFTHIIIHCLFVVIILLSSLYSHVSSSIVPFPCCNLAG